MMKKAFLILLICLSNGWLFANHWTPDDSGYEDNMTLTGVICINGIEQYSTNFEVGVFCGEECRGSGLSTYFFPTQRYVVQLLIFGEVGDHFTFKLYNNHSGQELDLVSLESVIFDANGYGSLSDPYNLNFTIDDSYAHWIPNDSDYEDNMTLTGIIQINGIEQQSTTLEVGVFCEEECRGTSLATYFFPTQRYVVQLLIFGETGNQLTFKLYDHAVGQELNLTSPDAVTFVANGYGSLGDPYVLNFTGELNEATQTLELKEGWNWISTYIQVDDPLDMLTMLENALGENGLTIKSSAEFTTYEDGEWGAMGELDDIGMVNQQMYMVQVSADCSVQLLGMLVNPETTIHIQPGWNWIGFPSSVTMSIEDALAGYEPEEGDIIKDEDDFSIYEDGEWGAMGELEELVAGRGFMFFSNANGTKILIIGH